METTSTVLCRIHKVRKVKQRNIHDCAAFLNISKEDYLQFEQGSKMLTLPEIELLALYLGVSPRIFFQPEQWENERLRLLDDHIQPQFTKLRDKMIQAKIIAKMKAEDLSSEKISNKTEIPLADLNSYQNKETPIPLDHLLKIGEAIGLTSQDLIEPFWQNIPENEPSESANQWQQDYVPSEREEDSQATYYKQLTLALQKLSEADQAEVAKFLLKKLQKLKNG
jgi:hypothetical protein